MLGGHYVLAYRSRVSVRHWVLCVALAGGIASCGPKVDTKKSESRLELAKDLLQHGKLEEAELEAEQALGFNAKNEEIHLVLGLIDFLRGVNSFLLMEQSDCVTGIDAEVLREEMDSKFAEADGHFRSATELAPTYGEAWSNRGLIALQREDYDQAVEHFERAFDGRQRLVNIGLTRAHLGWARFHQGKLPEALKELRQALQFNAGMCVAKYRLGRVYFAREEWNKALEQFREVVADESCPMQEASLYHVKTLSRLGMTDELPAAREQCASLAPKSCIARECRIEGAR